MEKGCIAYLTLTDEQISALRPFVEMQYSAATLQRNYYVLVREKAFTDAQFRTHVLRVLSKHKITAPRLKRNWLHAIPESHARELIAQIQKEPPDDSRVFVLSRPA